MTRTVIAKDTGPARPDLLGAEIGQDRSALPHIMAPLGVSELEDLRVRAARRVISQP